MNSHYSHLETGLKKKYSFPFYKSFDTYYNDYNDYSKML